MAQVRDEAALPQPVQLSSMIITSQPHAPRNKLAFQQPPKPKDKNFELASPVNYAMPTDESLARKDRKLARDPTATKQQRVQAPPCN